MQSSNKSIKTDVQTDLKFSNQIRKHLEPGETHEDSHPDLSKEFKVDLSGLRGGLD